MGVAKSEFSGGQERGDKGGGEKGKRGMGRMGEKGWEERGPKAQLKDSDFGSPKLPEFPSGDPLENSFRRVSKNGSRRAILARFAPPPPPAVPPPHLARPSDLVTL